MVVVARVVVVVRLVVVVSAILMVRVKDRLWRLEWLMWLEWP